MLHPLPVLAVITLSLFIGKSNPIHRTIFWQTDRLAGMILIQVIWKNATQRSPQSHVPVQEMCWLLSALWMEMGAPPGREQLDRNAYRIEFLYVIIGFVVMDTPT